MMKIIGNGVVLFTMMLLIGSAEAAGTGIRGAESRIQPGQVGIDWYTTWETGLAEAKRSGRPIIFMAAATQCSGVSGVF